MSIDRSKSYTRFRIIKFELDRFDCINIQNVSTYLVSTDRYFQKKKLKIDL